MLKRKRGPTPEELEQANWSYDSAPEGRSPYALLAALVVSGITLGASGYGYYSFVDDNGTAPRIVSSLLAIATSIGLFAYGVRRDGFEAGFREFMFLGLLLAPLPFGYLLYSGAGRLANVWLDFSPEKTEVVQVVQKRQASGRRLNQVKPNGRISVRRASIPTDVIVPQELEAYERINAGDTMLLTTRNGALGREWIVRLEPAPAE